jgi:hypothetical protein
MPDSGKNCKVGVNVEVDKDDARDIVTAIADTFSPVSESLGALGDSFRYYRSRSAIRNFQRTKEIAEKAGITLKAPPVRFLAPYIEFSSLNDENNATLSDMWSALLFEAGTNYSEKQIRFSRLLSEMTEAEARAFQLLCENEKDGFNSWPKHVSDAPIFWNPVSIRPLLNSMHEFDDVVQVYDAASEILDRPGSFLFELLLHEMRENLDYSITNRNSGIRKVDSNTFSSLSSTGLIKHDVSYYVRTQTFEISIFGTHVTDFGVSFFNSVILPTIGKQTPESA